MTGTERNVEKAGRKPAFLLRGTIGDVACGAASARRDHRLSVEW
jgi:hypothetical protein